MVDERPKKLTARAAGAALLGSAVAAVAYYAFMVLTGAQVFIIAIGVGVVAGFVTRWLGKLKTVYAGALAGLLSVAAIVGANTLFFVAYLADEGELAYAELMTSIPMLIFLALAFVGALFVTLGFEPVSVFLLAPESTDIAERPGREFEGTMECPECDSLQTEVDVLDEKTDLPALMICNACHHRWTPE